MKLRKILLVAFLFLFFTNWCSSQDKIILNDGRKLKCLILSEDSTFVNVVKENKNLSINKKNIKSIIYSYSEDNIILKDENSIDCKILDEDSSSITIITYVDGIQKKFWVAKKDIRKINHSIAKVDNKVVVNKFSSNRISFDIGPSFAAGDFGSTDIHSDKSGLAKTGICYNLSLKFKITNYLGIGIKGIKSIYSIDTKIIKEKFGGLNSEDVYASKWKAIGLFGGIILSAPGDIDLELRLLGGSMKLTSPELALTNTYPPFVITQESVYASALGYNIGLGIVIPLTKKINLLINSDYLNFKFDFKDIKVRTFNNEYTEDSEQPYHVINTSFGLGFNF